ncbi:hypothetical protein JOD31_000491 [Methylopila capsulata]|uniref:Uncharacterized protein n=1 Tax=Methylopila capsulata TaxID=61654 RepID=A0A9W6MRT1_9HYPH|nr:hypothetical protein [Methylopila capsulata]MBM7850279.1 hypothetical protein [Methylopila capsulata]GLK55572.1 hypothetical protein GCM10008170_15910 [Methylopila capsulata]
MGNAFVVEVRGRHAGLLIRLDDGFRFLASLPEVYDLDEQVFPDKAAACAAVEARFDALQAGHLPAYAAFSLGRVDDGLRLAS